MTPSDGLNRTPDHSVLWGKYIPNCSMLDLKKYQHVFAAISERTRLTLWGWLLKSFKIPLVSQHGSALGFVHSVLSWSQKQRGHMNDVSKPIYGPV